MQLGLLNSLGEGERMDQSDTQRNFDFGQALIYLKGGNKVARLIWNNNGWLQLNNNAIMIYETTNKEFPFEWFAGNHENLLADDWTLVDRE